MEFVNDQVPMTFWCHVCDMSVTLLTTTTVVACPHCCSDLLELMDSSASADSYRLDLRRLISHLSSADDDDDVIPPPPVNVYLLPASKAYVDVIPTVRMTSECGVCKEQFAEGKELTCGHVYHAECILPWLSSRSSCPLCRFQLPTDDQNVDYSRQQQRLQRLVHYRLQIHDQLS